MSNPFASRRVRPGAIPFQFPDGLDAVDLVARLAQLGWRGAIDGPHGTGKSTLLAALTPELERADRDVRSIALHDGQRRLPREFIAALSAKLSTNRQAMIIVDGYEQLSRWSRWRLDRRCRAVGAGLLVTAHGPTSLPLLFRTRVDAKLAERIVGYLLAVAGDSTFMEIYRDHVSRIWSKHRGNLRETLFDLYDAYEHSRAAGPNRTASISSG